MFRGSLVDRFGKLMVDGLAIVKEIGGAVSPLIVKYAQAGHPRKWVPRSVVEKDYYCSDSCWVSESMSRDG